MKYSDIKEDNCGIYAIVNKENRKIYIGRSHNIHIRWMMHKAALRNNRSDNRHLQYAWNKYGENSFDFKIIELCPIELLDDREVYWISRLDTCNSGYNISKGGKSTEHIIMDMEMRSKIRNALKGRVRTKQHCKNISIARKEWFKNNPCPNAKKIICLNTLEVFLGSTEMHNKYPSVDQSALHKHCKQSLDGKGHHSCGKDVSGNNLVWMYYDDYCDADEKYIEQRLMKGSESPYGRSSKAVKCLTTGKTFSSIIEASSFYHIRRGGISDCLQGRQKTQVKTAMARRCNGNG